MEASDFMLVYGGLALRVGRQSQLQAISQQSCAKLSKAIGNEGTGNRQKAIKATGNRQ